jgi:hypothetical protein
MIFENGAIECPPRSEVGVAVPRVDFWILGIAIVILILTQLLQSC